MAQSLNLCPELEALWKMRLHKLVTSLRQLYKLTKRRDFGGSLHTYVRGLILSSSIIDEARQDLSSQYDATWGQILKEDGTLSKEIDIIIYQGKSYYKWKNIGFAIVPKQNVKAIIECEEYPSKAIDYYEKVFQELNGFTSNVYLLFEHYAASPSAYSKTRERLIAFGFKDVFTLYCWYTHEGKNKISLCYDDWYRFLNMLRKL